MARLSHLLVIENDPAIRRQLESLYAENEYSVVALSSAEDSLSLLDVEDIDFVIADVQLPGVDGAKFIAQIHQNHPELPLIAITGQADIHTAQEALARGACNLVIKPLNPKAVLESTRAALDNARSQLEGRRLRRWFREHFEFCDMAGQTPPMAGVFETVRAAAVQETAVLIRGEMGTGKEQIASAIHHHSARRGGALVQVNCGGFAEDVLERQLFGYDESAVACAPQTQPGKIALAHGGTLFLDEIQSLSQSMQEKLLGVVQSHRLKRPGAPCDVAVDVRVIAAGDESIERRVIEGTLRRDFYDCLSAASIRLIPLRERRADIPLLVHSFLRHHPVAQSKRIHSVSDPVMARLREYSWPGNVRELHCVLERALLLAPGPIIKEIDLSGPEEKLEFEIGQDGSAASLRRWLQEKEKQFLRRRLAELDGNIALTAKSCRIGVRTLFRKMRAYGLNKRVFKVKSAIDRPKQTHCG